MATAIGLTTAQLIAVFPGLGTSPFEVTSSCDEDYNCIAWAAGEQGYWWWPGKFWPKEAPPVVTRLSFIKAFATKGYEACDGPELEVGHEKVCLYEKLGRPTHAARQLPDGRWTSKLGRENDIAHQLEGLTGTRYGRPVFFMRRPIPADPPMIVVPPEAAADENEIG